MKSEDLVKKLYEIRRREMKLYNEQNFYGDVTPRLLSDLRWILEIGEFAPNKGEE